MNFRLTMVLAAVMAVLGVATWYTNGMEPEPDVTAPSQSQGPVLIDSTGEDISEILVQSGTQQIVLSRPEGGDWTYATDGGSQFDPADTIRVRSLATRLSGLKAQSTIAESPDATALKEYGLDVPSMSFVVRAKSGDRSFNVGPENARRTGRYVRATDGGPVYLVESFVLNDLQTLTSQPPVPPTPTPTPTPTQAASPTAAPGATATP